MRVLVTNDDGIDAPGLRALALALDADGHEVLVVAPDRNHSGYGAALGDVGAGGDGSRLRTELRKIPGAEHLPSYALEGPPALCVMAALLGGFGDPPELVASGVNPGNNTGRAVLHSGTVGAALTAANFGISGLAISVAWDRWPDPPHYDAAAAVAAAGVEWLRTAPRRTVLNVNAPDRPLDELGGTCWARLAPFGTVRATLSPAGDSELELGLVPTGDELPPDTDSALVQAGMVAVTCLTGVTATDEVPVARAIDAHLAARAGAVGAGGS
ncbi:MAG: 5'/3'-nucleotidase SurE [Acidimicrobiales bacterium]|nr:5'/3'-nucleotidase SurE [Acidimicrobiales bacterium]